MPASAFLASHSIYVENVMRHCFLYEVMRVLLTRSEALMVTILNSEVDDAGVDIVLTLSSITRHIQMKTINKRHAPNSYNIEDALLELPGGCVMWMTCDLETMSPAVYDLLGANVKGHITEVLQDRLPTRQAYKKAAAR